MAASCNPFIFRRIAGPERFSIADIVSQFLTLKDDTRKAVADPQARYFDSLVDDQSIVPLGEARLGKITFREWMDKQAVKAS